MYLILEGWHHHHYHHHNYRLLRLTMGQSLGYTDDLSFYSLDCVYISTPLTSDPTLGMILSSQVEYSICHSHLLTFY